VTTSNVYESANQYISNSQGYDAMGRIAETTDPLGNVTTYGYDSLSRQTSVTTADTAVATTSYSGNTTTVKDQAGKTRALTYDGLGRL
jgi:YD repeat-containing protein